MDPIVIGEGNYGMSALIVYEAGDVHISQNTASYWISYRFLDIQLRVMKNTGEGEMLTHLLDEFDADDKVVRLVDELVFKHTHADILRTKINQKVGEAVMRGREHQASIVRMALMIDEP